MMSLQSCPSTSRGGPGSARHQQHGAVCATPGREAGRDRARVGCFSPLPTLPFPFPPPICLHSTGGHCLLQQAQSPFIAATYIRHLWTPDPGTESANPPWGDPSRPKALIRRSFLPAPTWSVCYFRPKSSLSFPARRERWFSWASEGPE